MARLLLAAAIALAVWGADCRTPLGIPCSTIRFETTKWQFTREGGLDLSHYTGVTISAVRSDGSFVEIADRQEMSRWFRREARTAGSASMYLAPDDMVVRVDHQQKSISRRAPLLWNRPPVSILYSGRPNLLERHSTLGRSFLFARHGHGGRRGGDPVVRRKSRRRIHGSVPVALLDCRPLKINIVHRRFGIL